LCCGAENLTDRQRARLEQAIAATNPVKGRRIAEGVLASLPTCPIPEIRRLGKTLKQRRAAFLADFDTGRAATEVPKPSSSAATAKTRESWLSSATPACSVSRAISSQWSERR